MAEPRFLVDVNVGRLAKWLRAMGYDSRYIPDAEDSELLRVAANEDRTIITRDRYILERRQVTTGQVTAVLLTSDDFREQMRYLREALGLDVDNVFSLCIECNQPLRSVCRQRAKDRVPSFVFRTQEQFLECPGCRKTYWRGTHWHNMLDELAGFTEGA